MPDDATPEPSQCSTCAFWQPDAARLLVEGLDGPEGDCRFNPPTTYPVSTQGETRRLSIWARTRDRDACGAYQPISKP